MANKNPRRRRNRDGDETPRGSGGRNAGRTSKASPPPSRPKAPSRAATGAMSDDAKAARTKSGDRSSLSSSERKRLRDARMADKGARTPPPARPSMAAAKGSPPPARPSKAPGASSPPASRPAAPAKAPPPRPKAPEKKAKSKGAANTRRAGDAAGDALNRASAARIRKLREEREARSKG